MLFKEGTPQSEELLRLAHDTISIWRKLGIALGLNDSYLDEINDDQAKVLDKSYAMLKKWRESFGSKATYARLAEALDHEAIKRLDLIERYCRDQGKRKSFSGGFYQVLFRTSMQLLLNM